MMGIMEVFIDTIVICTLTALVILTSAIPIPYGRECGPSLTVDAFTSVFGSWFSIPLAMCLCAFALATIFGWGLYGLRCAQYLFGSGVAKALCFLQTGMVITGAVVGTGAAWMLAETINGLMCIPNLVALFALSGKASDLTTAFMRKINKPTD